MRELETAATPAHRFSAISLTCAMLAAAPAHAQDTHPWIVPDLLAAAKAEGNALTIYASMNEEEAFPYWKVFEDATGIKVSFVRMSDATLQSRIAVEYRARQRTWDLVATTPVYRIPDDILLQFDPPEAKALIAQARAPNRRWYGVYGNYNAPAYNTNFVKTADLPKTYEQFLDHKEWTGKIAIDATDSEWLTGIFKHYGEERGRQAGHRHRHGAQAGGDRRPSQHRALGRCRRILGRTQQLRAIDHQCETRRGAD